LKALVKEVAGPGFALREVPEPRIRDDEVLIRVRRAGVCGTDVHIYAWDAWAQGRCRPPFVVGHEFAGDVVEVGALVETVKAGDRVTAGGAHRGRLVPALPHGNAHVCPHTKIIGVDRDGCFAEYIAMPATNVWHLDANVPVRGRRHPRPDGERVPHGPARHRGAGIGGAGDGVRADRAVRGGDLPGGGRVARDRGGRERTAARARAHDGGARRRAPDEAADAVKRATGGYGADVVLEMSGVPSAVHQAFALVRDGGRVQMLGIPSKPIDVDFAKEVIFKGITVYGVVGRRMYDTWHQMTRFLRSGAFDPTPVVTHRYPLECYDQAIHAIRSGAAGKVVFEVAD
jgi:threonine 3-dehydrogenase